MRSRVRKEFALFKKTKKKIQTSPFRAMAETGIAAPISVVTKLG